MNEWVVCRIAVLHNNRWGFNPNANWHKGLRKCQWHQSFLCIRMRYIICRCITSPARMPPKRFYDSSQHVVLLQHCNRDGQQLTTSSDLYWCICSHVFKWGCGCDRGFGNNAHRRFAGQRNWTEMQGISIPLSLTPLRQSFQKSAQSRTRTVRGCILYPLSVFFSSLDSSVAALHD